MKRYFFHVSGSGWQPDSIGTEMNGDEDARCAAIRLAGEIMCYEPQQLAEGQMNIDLHDQAMEFRMRIAVVAQKLA